MVPVADIDESVLMWSAPKCLQVLGFRPRSDIKRMLPISLLYLYLLHRRKLYYLFSGHHFMDMTDVVIPNKECPDSCTAFAAFVKAMKNSDQVAIVRYIKKDNASPVLGVMTVPTDNDDDILYLNQLPFSNDIRSFEFRPVRNEVKGITTEQAKACREFIQALDLSNAAVDEFSTCFISGTDSISISIATSNDGVSVFDILHLIHSVFPHVLCLLSL